MRHLGPVLAFVLACSVPAWAQGAPDTEEDYYPLISIPIPEQIQLEAVGIEILPEGRIAVSTRRGEIWILDRALENPPSHVTFKLFASGLHDALGLSWRDGWLYAQQRGELTRMRDTDGDGRADVFKTVCDSWSISGEAQEYAFSSRFDKDGVIWVVLSLSALSRSDVPFRGWCVRITPEGKMIPTCSGIRSPGGIGMNADGEMFCCDNHGAWNGASALKHLVPGSFQGHPDSLKWYSLAPNMGPKPEAPRSGSRCHVEAARIPEYVPPPILFPYGIVGNSASGIACDLSNGKFGPFRGQLFVSDQSFSVVNRCFLEKINGRYQGACFSFRGGFSSGNVAEVMSQDGSLWVGGTNRGWASRGSRSGAIERVSWSGKVPFEVLEMHAKHDGFELLFTRPAEKSAAENAASYAIRTFTYVLHSAYGSPEVDQTTPRITSIQVSEDGLKARIRLDEMKIGNIHEVKMGGVRSLEGKPLLHPAGWYTLWSLPQE
ncbi:MAG TPA: hypothetical protein VKU80_12770 [Planctomycetota bacterium]|nr:hypothetical protein [Planctomycetota bacterium]